MHTYVLVGFILGCIQIAAGLINSVTGETMGKRIGGAIGIMVNGSLALWAAYLLWL